MASIHRVRVQINGVVGPAFMNWYFSTNASANLTAIAAMVNAIKAFIPSTVSYVIPSTGDDVDENTGKLTGSWSAGGGSTVTGTSVNTYAAQAGALVFWITGVVVDAHRPKGRSIWVPIDRTAYDTNGRLASTFSSTLQTAASTFLSSSSGFVIWHRPVYQGSPPNRVLTRPGSSVAVASAQVSSTLATLRSRSH